MKKSVIQSIIALMVLLAAIAYFGRAQKPLGVDGTKVESTQPQAQKADSPKPAICADLGEERQTLNGGDWTLSWATQPRSPARTPAEFKNLAGLKTIPASVPANAEIDLFAAKLIDDPTVGDNVFQLRKYESCQWLYSRAFKSPDLKSGQRAVLNLQGVDTLADIFVNGNLVGSPENMFIAHKYDITDFLKKDADNTLEVIIRSAPIESKKYEHVMGGSTGTRAEFLNTRKAPASFGWDIHPRLVTAGLWRDVSIDIQNPVRIADIHFYTRKVDEKSSRAFATVDIKLDSPYDKFDDLTIAASFSKDGKTIAVQKSPAFTYMTSMLFDLKDVKLWWPRGYGDPALYDLCVEIQDKDGSAIARKTKKVGFRTVRLDFKELELPEGNYKGFGSGNVSGEGIGEKIKGEFKFYVNNTPIFMKGTNWVPLDASHSRDKSHVKSALDMAVDLNCNMIRCWGGNVYEDPLFFDICDRNGIMVWQDFSMGCSVYPQDSEYAKKIEKEVAAVVLQLRSHPCIALWAGNNENDQAYSWRGREFNMNPSHDRISRVVIPNVVREYDWSRPYLPSSPYLSAITIEHPDKYAAPEVHLWGPRGYYKDAFYKNAIAVFVSEIGYHGCPNRESLEKMMTKDFVYPWTKDGKWNKQWQAKAAMSFPNTDVEAHRNDLMTKQVKILFGEIPQDLDEFIFASQVVQAEAKKYFIELWRTQKFTPKTGILWWNLRDAWPILSDAIVDYYGSKKLAYDYIKRVQPDVCAMLNDNLEIVVANDTLKKATGKILVRDAVSKKKVFEGKFEVNPNAAATIGKLDGADGQGMFVIEYYVDGGEKNINHYMYGKPPFKLADYKKWFKELKIKR